MRKINLSIVLIFVLVTAGFAEQTINVVGSGTAQIEPDTATVRLGVEVSRKTAQQAQNDNAEIMQAVMGALARLGIAKEKVQTAGFHNWPEIKYEQGQPAKTVGYHCSNQVSVTVEDLAKVSKVVDAGIGAGANNVMSIRFWRKDDIEAKKSALDKAVREAADKSRAIAAAAGVRIKGIRSITESGATPPATALGESNLRAMAAGAAETPVSPGLIEIREVVTVSYSVE